jgi:uncharacterized protein YkwD
MGSATTRLLVCGLAGAFLLSPLVAPAHAVGDCTPANNWGTPRADFASQVVDLVNQHRNPLGLAALHVSPTLTASSVWKARHMAYYGYLAHDDPAPPVARSWSDRIDACGYPIYVYGGGENAAAGYPSPASVMQGWLDSPGHRANIEEPSWRSIGSGAAVSSGGTMYWALAFGPYDDSGAPPPNPKTVKASPSSVTVDTGAVRAGGVGALKRNDGSYFQVDSASGTTSWSARFTGVTNDLLSLQVVYIGSNSATCQQTVSLWNWTSSSWVALNSRAVGPSEVKVKKRVSGAFGDFVSSPAGSGDVLVQISCVGAGSFFASGDQLRIVYDSP